MNCTCYWKYVRKGDKYETECGKVYDLYEDIPDQSQDFEFCPYCGKPITGDEK